MNKVSKNIKNARIANKMTQEELSLKLSVTRQTISCWENGKSEPDIDTLIKISDIFKININELLNSEAQTKKAHKGIKAAIFILFLIIFTFVLLIPKQDYDICTINKVFENPNNYLTDITQIENIYFEISESNGKIAISKKDVDNFNNILIKDWNHSENGDFIIRGKTTPIYQNKNGGKIIIPAVYSESYFPATENFLDSISHFDYNKISSAFVNSTGSGIIVKNENPFDSGFICHITPFSYRINIDGSVDFELIINNFSNQSSKISSEDTPLIVLKCITLEWENNEPIYDIYNAIH